MTRTSRLLRLMDLLRSRRTAVTAAELAGRLGVSVRTVYRDVQALAALGAAIEGDAGVGYILRSGFFLPPLMFSDDQIEALVLGVRWVQQQGDGGLAEAADEVISRIAAAGPKDLRDRIDQIGLWAPRRDPPSPRSRQSVDLGALRGCIRLEHKVRLHYADLHGARTERVVWPIALGFFEGRRVFAGWCELRDGFRHFRVDRVERLEPLHERYPVPRRALVRDWKQQHATSADS